MAEAIVGPAPLGVYPLSPVTGATVQEKVLPDILEVKFISVVVPPEQMV